MKRLKSSYREMGTDFLVTLSLSNLVFFKQWSDLTRPPTPWRFEAVSAFPASHLGLMASVLVLAIVLWLPFLIARLRHSRVEPLYLILLPFFFLALNGVRGGIRSKSFSPGALLAYFPKPVGLGIALAILALALFLIFRQRRFLPALFRTVFLGLAPFVLMTFGNSASYLASAPPPISRPEVPHNPNLGRVVWIIFDMWDYRLTYEDRIEDLAMPNIEKFGRQAFSGTTVSPPGSWTPLSIPGYLFGRSVHELLYVPEEKSFMASVCGPTNRLALRDQPNVFSRAKDIGARTAAVGWHLPYCQLLGANADYCDRFPVHNELRTPYLPELLPSMANFFHELTFLSQSEAYTHLESFAHIRDLAVKRASDPDLDFVYVHWPIPHDPYLYDRDADVVSLKGNRIQTYWDNLALTDKVFGEMRRGLENAGLWDKSTVIVTSDHGATRRKLDGKGDTVIVSSDLSRQTIPGRVTVDTRIPFLVKLPNQQDELIFDKPFNSIIAYDLVEEFLEKKISDKVALANDIQSRDEQSRRATECMEQFQLDGGLP